MISKLSPQYFRRLRKKEDKTLKAWGEVFGVKPNSVYRWESGENPIPAWVVIILGMRRQIKTLEAQLSASQEKVSRMIAQWKD